MKFESKLSNIDWYVRRGARRGIKMKARELISAVVGMIGKVALVMLAVYLIYTGATTCYSYGYRIFTETPVSAGEGRKVTVEVKKDMSPLDMGELFESKGLVRDAKLFALQFYLSEYRKEFKPGVYELSTSMTVEDMMEVMSSSGEET